MSGGISNEEDGSIEDTILDEVKALTGDDFNEDDDVSETEEDQPEPQEEQPADKPAPAKAARPDKVNQRERGDNTEVQRWINARRHTDYNYDKDGSVVDKDGKVIYAIGTPARDLFAAVKNEQFKHSQVLEQGQQLFKAYNEQKQQLDSYTKAFEAAGKSGLKPQDQALAMEHMIAFKANPTQALRKMLTDYQVDGGDLSDIFEDLPKLQLEGVEARLKQLADRADTPQREKAAEEQRVSQMMESLNREVTTFFAENPAAETHSDTLAHIINSAAAKGQKVTLSQAWIRLMQFCNEKGLSINQSLQSQLSEQAPQQRRQAPPKPMPGRGRSNGLAPSKSAVPAHERRNRDFVREAMEEAGISFDD